MKIIINNQEIQSMGETLKSIGVNSQFLIQAIEGVSPNAVRVLDGIDTSDEAINDFNLKIGHIIFITKLVDGGICLDIATEYICDSLELSSAFLTQFAEGLVGLIYIMKSFINTRLKPFIGKWAVDKKKGN